MVYARRGILSESFIGTCVVRAGFQTVLYHTTLNLNTHHIVRYGPDWYKDNDDAPDLEGISFYLEVMGPDKYVLSASDVQQLTQHAHGTANVKIAIETSPNPVAKYFAIRHCRPLNDRKLAVLMAKDSINVLGFNQTVRNIVQHLINRYQSTQ